MALVWILHGKEPCGEASQITVVVCWGLAFYLLHFICSLAAQMWDSREGLSYIHRVTPREGISAMCKASGESCPLAAFCRLLPEGGATGTTPGGSTESERPLWTWGLCSGSLEES